MKYERFEDLPVWNAAIDLALRVFSMTEDEAFNRQGDLRSQLRRAALSVSNNIAEGFERGSTSELISFLYIARGSAGEVRSMLIFTERSPWSDRHTAGVGKHKSEISNFKSEISNRKPEISGPKSEISNFKSEVSNLRSEISHLRSEISDLKSLAESCSRQLRAWADSLQNSDIKGPRHLTDAGRAKYDQRKRRDAFVEKLQLVRDGADAREVFGALDDGDT